MNCPVNEPMFSQLALRLRAREGVRVRQLLLDIDQIANSTAFAGDSIPVLKEKLNKALLKSQGGMTDHKIRAVTRLRNGGILMEWDSNKAVEWFQLGDVCSRFLAKLCTSRHLHQAKAVSRCGPICASDPPTREGCGPA